MRACVWVRSRNIFRIRPRVGGSEEGITYLVAAEPSFELAARVQL